MVWPEVEQALTQHRYELVLSGDKLTKYLEEKNQLDETIWKLKRLNFLEISFCPSVEEISNDIGKLVHLSTLTLISTKLTKLPSEIKNLENLRHVNLSNNQLKSLDEDLFLKLSHLETLNLSHNLLESFPKFSTENKKLAILNLSHNQLVDLPDFPVELDNLSHVDLSSNQFQDFPTTLLQLNSLKTIIIDSNQLVEIPAQLSQLHKLKELRFKSNPLKDNRLKKLMEQDKLKPVLEYLAKQWNEQQKSTTSKPAQKKQPQQQQQQQAEATEQVQNKIEVLHFDQEGDLKGRQITILPRVINVRPHLLCCIVRNVDLATAGNLKKFLNLQNELHDDICQKRTLATIGTHDLSLISGHLVYDARDPDEIGLVPLGKGPKLVSARDFYDQLCRDAEHERKLKKRNQLSGLNKYLTLLQDQTNFPCLSDQERYVISLPPLTNAERSKLSSTTDSIFIEITSGQSMDICRRVMDALLRQMIQNDLGKKSNESNIRQILTLQQTKVVDDKGQLKTTFPSRTDLDWIEISQGSIAIERLYSDK
ncbi:unnamed protein product [Adineta steineri]|uniref:B3/B4 tRNA-binding domain-containing protein n=1 Tax=Adineta steineri TaxID=433720 RepID=A0A819J423_9BILA|nr:unnamed protein product [Adineta steineri]